MTANRPIEVWEAALGRHVVLIEARTWFEARDVARLMLGGEPEWVETPPAAIVAPLPHFRGRMLLDTGEDYPSCLCRFDGDESSTKWGRPCYKLDFPGARPPAA